MSKIDTLIAAMARQEGFGLPGKVPTIRNNPICLRYAGQIGAEKPQGWKSGEPAPIAAFESLSLGVAAAYRQVWKWVAEGHTLRSLIARHAPPTENKTETYIRNVTAWSGILPEQVLLDLVQLSTAAASDRSETE